MPCISQPNLTPVQVVEMSDAIKRLEKALGNNEASLVIGTAGSIAFKGWNDRAGVSDLCAFRKLASSNSATLRRAIARAEAIAGRSIDQRSINAGVHSHDGGKTWGKH
jgi:hypothetical protein